MRASTRAVTEKDPAPSLATTVTKRASQKSSAPETALRAAASACELHWATAIAACGENPRPVSRTRCPSAKVPPVLAASCARNAGTARASAAEGDREAGGDAPRAGPAASRAATSAAARSAWMTRSIAPA